MPPVERSGSSSASAKKEADGRKQASLFSFFQKKKPETPGPSSRPHTSSSSSSSSSASKPSPPPFSSSSSSSSSGNSCGSSGTPAANKGSSDGGASGSKPSAASSSLSTPPPMYGKEVVGKRVQVWWPEDEEFYLGTVTAFSAEGDGKHTVTYDDGEAENVYLAKETIRWGDPTPSSHPPSSSFSASTPMDEDEGDGEQEEEAAATAAASAAAASARKRRVVQEETDSESEFDFASGTHHDAERNSSYGGGCDNKVAPGSSLSSFSTSSKATVGGKRARLDSLSASEEDEDEGEQWRGKAKSSSSGSSSGSSAVASTPFASFRHREDSAPATAPRSSSSSSSKAVKGTPASSGTSSKLFTTPYSSSSSSCSASKGGRPSLPGGGGSNSISGGGGSGSIKKGGGSMLEEEEDDEVVAAAHDRPDGVLECGKHTHHGLKWLWEPHRKDAEGRKPDDPQYNPRTLYVPPSFLAKETPAMKQWWEFKAQHFDTILFFKVGKFYEIFHTDADVAVKELELIYMKGDKAHSGFPEIAYGKFAPLLVDKGYRVARIEQVETPEGMKEYNRTCGVGRKRTVVARELCSVLSKGTRTFCYLDEASFEGQGPGDGAGGPMLMVIKEEEVPREEVGEEGEGRVVFGVCMVDPTTATFHLGQFEDNDQRWRLKTMLSQHSPAEVLLERGRASTQLEQMVRFYAPGALLEWLRPEEEFWGPETTVRELKHGGYFPKGSKKGDGRKAGKEGEEEDLGRGCGRWPLTLQVVVAARRQGGRLALSALGGAVWQLRRSLIDRDLVSMQNFFPYAPPDDNYGGTGKAGGGKEGGEEDAMEVMAGGESKGGEEEGLEEDAFFSLGGMGAVVRKSVEGEEDDEEEETSATGKRHAEAAAMAKMPLGGAGGGGGGGGNKAPPLVLDGTTLTNLEVFRNSYDGTGKGTLWEHLNHCQTAFGARKLKDMLCRPSQRPGVINARLDAITELMNDLSPEADGIRRLLKKMPDLERQLARHHALGSVHRAADHPDSRAIMYENDKYNGRKIQDFLSALEGLKTAGKVKAILVESAHRLTSALLQRLAGTFPDLTPRLAFFSEAFDPVQAKREGVITPKPGYDEEYDQAKEGIAAVMGELDAYLKEQRQRLGSNEVKFWGTKDKDRFQLEVPEAVLRKGQPADYEAKSSKKGCRRFHTPRIRALLEELGEAEAHLAEAQRDEMRRLFEKFDQDRPLWTAAVNNLALLDVLLSLAEVSSRPGYSRPELVPYQATEGRSSSSSSGGDGVVTPFISIKGGRHPCLEARATLGDYIPNDLDLGVAQTRPERVMLLSGPNMGGKSTLLRQTCVLTILAQVGCFVPAEECKLTPVDRIFTRVGASDRILQGQSTFFVELAETANILQHATGRSLVILDELGRGTSTFDGTAIAHAVVSFLVQRLQCRALFATHYHSLVEDWRGHAGVCFGHMACLVEPDEAEQRVTFLYRLADGPSPKSYGLNVARLAHLPKEVIELAREKSESFEAFMAQQQQQQQQQQQLKHQEKVEGGEMREGGMVHPQLALGAEVFALLVKSPMGITVEEKAAQARALWTAWNAQ